MAAVDLRGHGRPSFWRTRGSGRTHTRIVLSPDSDRDGHEPIMIEQAEEADEAELHVIAELIGVIS